MGPWRGEHCFQPGARVVGAADRLQGRAFADIDLTNAQPVGVGVLNRLDDLGDAEGAEAFRRIFDMLDLKADFRQRLDDQRERRVGFQMVLEPGKREFHCIDFRKSSGLLSCAARTGRAR